MKSVLLASLLVFASVNAFAEDWTTTDGTNYQNVRVVKVEDDAVTILYKDGGALIYLSKLPASLQARYNYDPVKAKAASDARVKQDQENAVAMQKEMEQAAAIKKKQQVQDAEAVDPTVKK